MRIGVCIGAAVAVLATVASARAASESLPARSAWEHKVTPKVHFGSTHAPFGALGGSIEFAPNPYLAVDAGAGTGRGALTAAALLRGRYGDDTMRMGIGAGISTGRAHDDKNACGVISGAFIFPVGGCAAMRSFGSREIDRAWFAVTELTWEMRSSAGLHGGVAFGWAHLLNRTSDWQCLDDCASAPTPPRGHGYFTLSFGWSFG